MIENEDTDNLKSRAAAWLNDGEQEIDFSDDTEWTTAQSADSTELGSSYAAADHGIATGSSLLLSESSNLHLFSTYGMYNSQKIKKLIEIEYRKRF